MKYFATVDRSVERLPAGAKNYPIFLDEKAPIAGCNASMGQYYCEEYPTPGVHEDNEGFYVVSGKGMAVVGDEENKIAAGSFFYAPAGVPHAIKKDAGTPDLEIVMFHFAK
ncbi:cupin domain-containing protein [Marasmitruncus massiliensis]|uniref:cupin domain-containing protein n=1 Tax=Marasmitruncus massiliensis TaxID=1944642 RepID=UPI000C79B45C|nr:cupin domain-containing protein [Marasmitruncus massiliensis]